MTEQRGNIIVRGMAKAIASRPGAWFYVNVAPHIDRPLMRLTGGRLNTVGTGRVGVLRVRGAKSGKERRTPLAYTRDGDKILVVASRGGDVKHPAWYRNVMANPDVGFLARGREREYVAHEAEGAERERAWEMVNRTYAGYAAYQERAGARRIPVIVLEPAGPATA
jgi:deazaflavin-dependent oxidoreductase (nitroreductase family)